MPRREALAIGRKLVQQNPNAHLPDLAETLNNLAVLDRDQNRTEKAQQEFKEALAIYRDFAKKDPKQFSPKAERVQQLLESLPR